MIHNMEWDFKTVNKWSVGKASKEDGHSLLEGAIHDTAEETANDKKSQSG